MAVQKSPPKQLRGPNWGKLLSQARAREGEGKLSTLVEDIDWVSRVLGKPLHEVVEDGGVLSVRAVEMLRTYRESPGEFWKGPFKQYGDEILALDRKRGAGVETDDGARGVGVLSRDSSLRVSLVERFMRRYDREEEDWTYGRRRGAVKENRP